MLDDYRRVVKLPVFISTFVNFMAR